MRFDQVHIKSPEMHINSGKPGSGKTVLTFSVADRINKLTGKQVYVAIQPEDRPIETYPGIPKHIHSYRGELSKEKVPLDSIVVVDDLQRIAHARRFQSDVNVLMDQMHALLRHNNVDFIYDTQTLAGVDKNNILRAEYRWYKQPYQLEREMGREAVAMEIEAADMALEGYNKRWAYLASEKYTGLISDIPLPPYWTEELSVLHRRQTPAERLKNITYRRIL